MHQVTTWRTWRQAMADALYGDRGFYLGASVPSRHFRTAAHSGSSWAAAITALAEKVDEALETPEIFTVVDIGAGGGELLTELAATSPERWSLVGVDVADRPAGLPTRVAWQRRFPDDVRGLVLAVELLDVVPVDVVELAADAARLVEVDEDGIERLGEPADRGDRDWIAQWWPLRSVGDRAEIGWPRDEIWRAITTRVTAGLAVAVDYSVDLTRDTSGTLTGYRDGKQQLPIPDRSMDLTTHVTFGSLRQDGDTLLPQREALRRLGLSADPPAYDENPEGYLAALEQASEQSELLDPTGLGGFTWLLHPVDIPPLLTG